MNNKNIKIGRYYSTNEFFGSVLKTLGKCCGHPTLIRVKFIKSKFPSMLNEEYKVHISHFKNYKIISLLKGKLLYENQ